MKLRTLAMTAAVLNAVLLTLEAPALAQATENRCHQVRGSLVETVDPATGTATGTLRNAGWLNGTVEAVFNSSPFATPDANKVTFSSTMTITTPHGELKGVGRVYLFDFVTGRGTDMTDIDPEASTGAFAGTTGVLYTNLLKTVSPATGPFHSALTGRICFPRRDRDHR